MIPFALPTGSVSAPHYLPRLTIFRIAVVTACSFYNRRVKDWGDISNWPD